MMRRLAAAVAGLAVLGGGVFWALTRPSGLDADTRRALLAHAADPARGEQVFWAGGCAGCHAAPGLTMTDPVERRLILSGGRALVSDFGTFRPPNISMDPVHGIGGWTLEQFATAMLRGVSPDGAHYYPAFPYTSYVRATPQDVADLWAFWQGLPADATPSRAHELAFPFTLRRGIGLWTALNLDPAYVMAPSDDPQIARGRYLVEGLGHCAECHTPRDATGGLDRARWLQGAPNPSGEGRIPPIPDPGWSAQDIALYLERGFTPSFDVAGGSMADVVVHMARLPASDREAIAAYLVAVR